MWEQNTILVLKEWVETSSVGQNIKSESFLSFLRIPSFNIHSHVNSEYMVVEGAGISHGYVFLISIYVSKNIRTTGVAFPHSGD